MPFFHTRLPLKVSRVLSISHMEIHGQEATHDIETVTLDPFTNKEKKLQDQLTLFSEAVTGSFPKTWQEKT